MIIFIDHYHVFYNIFDRRFNVAFACTQRHEKKNFICMSNFKNDDLTNDTLMNFCRTWKIMFECIALNYHVNVTLNTRTSRKRVMKSKRTKTFSLWKWRSDNYIICWSFSSIIITFFIISSIVVQCRFRVHTTTWEKNFICMSNFKIDDLTNNTLMNSCWTWEIMFELIALNYHVNVTLNTRTSRKRVMKSKRTKTFSLWEWESNNYIIRWSFSLIIITFFKLSSIVVQCRFRVHTTTWEKKLHLYVEFQKWWSDKRHINEFLSNLRDHVRIYRIKLSR